MIIRRQDDIEALEFRFGSNTGVDRHWNLAHFSKIQTSNILHTQGNFRRKVVDAIQVINHTKVWGKSRFGSTYFVCLFHGFITIPIGSLNDGFIRNMYIPNDSCSLNYFSSKSNIELIIKETECHARNYTSLSINVTCKIREYRIVNPKIDVLT